MEKTNLDKILNEALNKALIGKNKIKQVNSNEIADFVNKHLAAINYTHSCKSDSEQLHTEVFNLANKLAINGYGNEAVKMHIICNGM